MDFINGETISIFLFFIGIYGLIAKRNIIKTVISLGIIQGGIILYFITANYVPKSIPPMGDLSTGVVADPLPQALMITEIVIGVGITATALTMFIHLYHKYGTASWLKLMRKRRNR